MRVLERIILIQSRNYETEAGVKAAERALDELALDLDSRVVFGLLVTTAGLQLSLGREVQAERLLKRAQSAAATDEDRLDSAFYDVRARLRGCHGEYADAMADFAESIRIARAMHGGDAAVRVLTNAADLYATLGRTEEALHLWTEAHDLSRVRHLGWRVPFTAFGLAGVLLNMGELARATGYVELALRYDSTARAVRVRAAEVGIPLGMLVGRVDIVTRCDDAEIVERVFSSHDAARLVSLAAAYIPLLLERGAVADAKSLLKRAAGMLASGDEPPMLYVLVAQHAALGGLAEARSALVKAAGRSAEHVANALLPLFDAVVSRRRRRIAASHEGAIRAAAMFRRSGMRLWEAMSVELAGDARAVSFYKSMGAVREVTRLEAQTSPQMPAQGQLTPREAEVAVLVRENMSNREISDTLGITQHTVESHLKSIFNRLGIRSRWQIDRVLSGD
jgi:ATP/maltotriose-dependent transcriptional regulator MalT